MPKGHLSPQAIAGGPARRTSRPPGNSERLPDWGVKIALRLAQRCQQEGEYNFSLTVDIRGRHYLSIAKGRPELLD